MAGIDFDAVRARHRLGPVARRTGLAVPDAGRVMVCCPLPDHDDRRPSMHLDLDRDRYYCFGCGAHGDVIQWVSDVENVRPGPAVAVLDDGRAINRVQTGGTTTYRYLAQPGLDGPDLERTPPERVQAAMQTAWRYYTFTSLHHQAVRYLVDQRNIDIGALEVETGRPVVGHTPSRPDGLTQWLRAQHFTNDELVDAGLATRRRDSTVIDFFRHRLLLPVTDDRGQVIGIIGRTTTDRTPKYLNQTLTHTYDKHLALYRPSYPTLDPDANVVVAEGTLDALAIATHAARSGVSTKFAPVSASGLHLSDEQLDRILAIHDRAPVLAGDGDRAGRDANLTWAARAIQRGRESVAVTWPEGHDPGSWLAAHGEDGLCALTRKGCLDAPPGTVRPHHCGAIITQAALDGLPAEGDQSVPLSRIADDVTTISNRLGPKAGDRYAAAAAEVLAPVVVNVGIDAATDGYQVTALIEHVAAYGAKLPPAGQTALVERAAEAFEANGLGAAGWVQRRLSSAIRVNSNAEGGDQGVTLDNRIASIATSTGIGIEA